jgi:hypothetical protein
VGQIDIILIQHINKEITGGISAENISYSFIMTKQKQHIKAQMYMLFAYVTII